MSGYMKVIAKDISINSDGHNTTRSVGSVTVETGESEPAEIKPFEIGPLGLVVNGKPTFTQWYDFGLTLREIKNAVQWAVGDWCNYGEAAYGDKYAQALEETQYAYGTLRNYASVAQRVDLSHRVTELSWSHHSAVASLPPVQQEKVLLKAKTERLGRDDLKPIVKAVKKELGMAIPPEPPKPIADVELVAAVIIVIEQLAEQLSDVDGAEMLRVVIYKVQP